MHFWGIFCIIRSMTEAPFTFIYGAYIPACDHRIDKYFEGYFTLQYMDAGAVEVIIDQQRYALNGQYFWSAWPGPRIAFHPPAGTRTWVHRYVAFKGRQVEDWKKAELFPILPQRAPAGSDFADRFDALLRQFSRGETLGTRRGIHMLEGILLELAEARTLGDRNSTWSADVIRQLERWVLQGPPDYEALARRLGMSVSTLRRQFKRVMGVSPHEYFLSLRIAIARRMLAESPMPIKTIARRLGYQDVFYFSRQFHSLAGVTPAAYRRSAQG